MRIAPRLAGGLCRETFGSRLAPDVKQGLRAIARAENKSMSWVVEQVIIEYFNLRRPKYDPRYQNVVPFVDKKKVNGPRRVG
jgi:hypothetical protein